MIIHHYRRHLWANPSLYLKASFGLHFPLANGKEELLGSPCSLPCALQKVLRSQLYALLFPYHPANMICFYFGSLTLNAEWFLETI